MTSCNTAVGKRNGGLNPFLSDMWRDRVEHVQLGDTLDVSPDLFVFFSKFIPSSLNKFRITRAHWKDGEKCYNRKCGTTFSSKNPIKHCFTCGHPYCRACLVWKRRLGANARPSPLGIECPVCVRCSDDGGVAQSLGHVFLHTGAFMRFRGQSQACHMQPDKPSLQELATSHRGRVITSQLEHLRKEFDQRHSLFLAMTIGVPDWQKSSHWPHQEDSKTCTRCNKGLKAILSYKIHCRLCGLMHCTKCAQGSLLLYHNSQGVSTWAIVGCNEPPQKSKKYAILPACEDCLGLLQPFAEPPSGDSDGNKEETERDPKDEESEVFYTTLTHLQEQGMHHRMAISGSLPYYVEVIHEEEERQQANGGKQPLEVPKEIAQLHRDIQKYFKALRDTIMSLKSLQGVTERQNTLKQNVLRGCLNFHDNHVMLYRACLVHIQPLLPAVRVIGW